MIFMLALLGIIQFLLIAFICLFEFKNKSASVFLWATLLLIFGIMHMLTSFSGDYLYNNSVLIEVSVFAIVFCLIYLLFRTIVGNKVILKNRQLFNYDSLKETIVEHSKLEKILLLMLVAVLLLKIIPYIRYTGGFMNTSWSSGRDYTATLSYANSLQVYNIIFYSLSGLSILFYISGKKKYFSATIIILLLNVLLSRNRIEVLPLICSVIAIPLLKTKKIRFKTIIVGVLFAVLTLYVVYGIRVYRHYGTISNFINEFNIVEFTDKIYTHIRTGNGELGLIRDFYYFVNNNNEFEGFGSAATYLRMLLVYIPTRFSFGLKPPDFAITMGQAIGMLEGGSTHPTLLGDCYANFGIFGMFMGAFWAIYVTIIDKIIIKCKSNFSKILLFNLNSVVYCIMGRGSVYNGFWFVAYGMPLILIVYYFIKSHDKKKSYDT